VTRVAARRVADTSDAGIIRAVAAGDLGALGTLFDRYEPSVRRFVARLGVPGGDVDDVIQGVFLQVMHSASAFDGRANARAWVLGIAANLVRRHQRSLARLARRAAAWALETYDRPVPSAQDDVESRQAAERAMRALQSLSPKKREVFVMIVLEGVRGEDAAAALGIPVATVWTRLHHARRELRAALRESAP
jgi:RNA polymerase sigma-70 factor (ECF subfamily)